jgi:hypothetical protein
MFHVFSDIIEIIVENIFLMLHKIFSKNLILRSRFVKVV